MNLNEQMKRAFRLKRPCANCPFRTQGAISLMPGRLEGIIENLLADDTSSFSCHKTVHNSSGGEWDDDGNYTASGNEAQCAGANAYLMKVSRPSVSMRLGMAFKAIDASHWDDAKKVVIEPLKA